LKAFRQTIWFFHIHGSLKMLHFHNSMILETRLFFFVKFSEYDGDSSLTNIQFYCVKLRTVGCRETTIELFFSIHFDKFRCKILQWNIVNLFWLTWVKRIRPILRFFCPRTNIEQFDRHSHFTEANLWMANLSHFNMFNARITDKQLYLLFQFKIVRYTLIEFFP
jgi:hypothetical protein